MKKPLLFLLLPFCLLCADDAMRVSAVKPKILTLNETLVLHGSLQAKDDVAIASALQGRRVIDVLADVSQRVKKGEILAVLESVSVQSDLEKDVFALEAAKQNLASAAAAFDEADAALKRSKKLLSQNAVNREAYEQILAKRLSAKANLGSAKAQVEQAKAQLKNSKNEAIKVNIVSPIDGVVTAKSAKIGMITDAQTLFNIAKDGVFEFSADANAREISKLQSALNLGAALNSSVEIDGAQTGVTAKIRQISVTLNETTKEGKVKFSGDFAGGLINNYGKASVELPSVSALALPARAVRFKDGAAYVTVITNKTARKKQVTAGIEKGGFIQISGLNEDELVAANAGALINEGDALDPQLIEWGESASNEQGARK